MKYLNKNIEPSTQSICNKSLANRSSSEGIFKISDFNIFLVKESGQGPRSLAF